MDIFCSLINNKLNCCCSSFSAIVEEEIEEELDEIETNLQRNNCDTAERKRPLSWSEQAELEMPLDDKPM